MALQTFRASWKNKTQLTNLSSTIETKQITLMNSINMKKYNKKSQNYKLIKVKTKKMKENTLKNNQKKKKLTLFSLACIVLWATI
jgi:hypothetical protein